LLPDPGWIRGLDKPKKRRTPVFIVDLDKIREEALRGARRATRPTAG
jgi:hypothetical protein